jgi:tripartite-type tricarboxylate transporter receptor subunit TctC
LKSVDFAAYRLIAGTYALQYSIVAPPGVPDDIAAALRKAVAAAFNDPRAIQDVRRKMSIDYNFLDGAEAKKVYETLAEEARANPAARDLVAKMIEIK